MVETTGPGATLAGRLIAVTRPAAQCATLVEAIHRRGGEALVFPLIVIEPIDDSPEIQRIRQCLGDFDLAFFVSPNAIEIGVAALGGVSAWPEHLAVSTVGAGSRAALETLGFRSVIAPDRGSDSEAVLALPQYSDSALSGTRLLIVRGDGGRDLLGQVAADRGAEVTYLSCYRRRPPSGDADALLEAACSGRLAAITATSSEALANLAGLVGEGGLERLRSLPLFVPHHRIAERAASLGFAQVIETGAGDRGLLSGLDAHFGSVG